MAVDMLIPGYLWVVISMDSALVGLRLQSVPLFSCWPDEAIQVLAGGSLRYSWEPASLIIRQGEVLRGLYVISSGVVSLYYTSEEGFWYKRRVVDKNWLIGFLSVFDGLGQPHSYEAEDGVEGLIVSRESLVSVLQRWPDLWFDIAAKMAANHRVVLKDLEESTLDSPRRRLLQLLIHQASYDERANLYVLKITQQELATLIGISRQTVSHILGELRADRLIEISYGKLVLLNRTRLLTTAGIRSYG